MGNDPRSMSGGKFGLDAPEETRIFGRPGDVRDIMARAMPRTAIYVTEADTLQFQVTSDANNIALVLSARILLADGTIQYLQSNPTCAGGGNGLSFFLPLPEGWLISAACSTTTTGVPSGAATVVIILQPLALGSAGPATILAQGDLETAYFVAWPGSPVRPPTAGIGWPRTLAAGPGGGGAPLTLNLSSFRRIAVDSAQVQFTTSAAVANRFVFLGFNIAGNEFYQCTAGIAQAAGVAVVYNFAPGVAFNNANSLLFSAPMPPNIISAPDAPIQVQFGAVNIQAGDVFAFMQVRIRQWHECD